MTPNNSAQVNFMTEVFAQISDVEALRAIANSICQQVKAAFDSRVAEITGTLPAPAPPAPAKKAAKKETAKAKKAKETAKKEAKKTADDSDVITSLADTKAIAALGLTFAPYSERSYVLRGNTKPLRNILGKELHGKFNANLDGGAGWIFRAANIEEVAAKLGIKIKAA